MTEKDENLKPEEKSKKSFFVSTGDRPKPKGKSKMVTTHDLSASPPNYYGKPRPKGKVVIVTTHDLDSNGVLIKKKEANNG